MRQIPETARIEAVSASLGRLIARCRIASCGQVIARYSPRQIPRRGMAWEQAAGVTLEPGFVNAPKPHPGGLPWFVRGHLLRTQRVPTVRVPAVVTCRCGADNLLPSGADAMVAAVLTARMDDSDLV